MSDYRVNLTHEQVEQLLADTPRLMGLNSQAELDDLCKRASAAAAKRDASGPLKQTMADVDRAVRFELERLGDLRHFDDVKTSPGVVGATVYRSPQIEVEVLEIDGLVYVADCRDPDDVWVRFDLTKVSAREMHRKIRQFLARLTRRRVHRRKGGHVCDDDCRSFGCRKDHETRPSWARGER